ncbi:hypothetical protein Ae201684P_017833 [Aphanomyces euteiches]|uniref:Uncharacterized protein n=1 Tax=Aphanomyces euteiches TaxID=100861 RepID=A0A6G0XN39_9STRA|nr:hypothetical protein Ae201684_002999 [Aphanomyces euteiches]KAH9098621.1 hypothetical protein Ae201684P_017833 [Aphanomyces euteiches]
MMQLTPLVLLLWTGVGMDPGRFAIPAELKFAARTSHVDATPVLLNVLLAFWTVFHAVVIAPTSKGFVVVKRFRFSDFCTLAQEMIALPADHALLHFALRAVSLAFRPSPLIAEGSTSGAGKVEGLSEENGIN